MTTRNFSVIDIGFTAIGAAALACVVALDINLAVAQSFPAFILDPGGVPIGRDFINTWMGGRSAFLSGPAAWFDSDVYMSEVSRVTGLSNLGSMFVWAYPPHLLLFIWPFGLLKYLSSYVIWCAGGLALYVRTAIAGGVERQRWLFLSVAPAVAVNVFMGQNGFLTAVLLIGGLANLDRRPILAGVLFGILTIKPQFGLLLPVLLVLRGHWRVIGSALATTALLVVVTAIWFGPDIWTLYLQKVPGQQRELLDIAGIMSWPIVASVFVNARLIGLPDNWAWVVQWAASACAFAAVVWTFWRQRDPVLSQALFVTATFLFTPWILNYDMVVFGWIVALLRQRSDETLIDHALSLAVWVLPAIMFPLGFAHVPSALLVLPLFGARLLWRLAHNVAKEPSPTLLPTA